MSIKKPLVIIESPYAGDTETNVRYLRAALLDSLRRGEAPFASHALYTQVLDDLRPDERELGMQAGFQFTDALAHIEMCTYSGRSAFVAAYVDRGISDGMKAGMERAVSIGLQVIKRSLGPPWGDAP